MTRTKQQELEQAQNLHLIRDERDLYQPQQLFCPA